MKPSSHIDSKAVSALRTIGEVAEQLNVPQHVLRFWEGKFNQIVPEKHRGRRYYRPQDISVLQQIKGLLYDDKYTIKGVQEFLNSQHTKQNIEKKEIQRVLKTLRTSRNLLKEVLNGA